MSVRPHHHASPSGPESASATSSASAASAESASDVVRWAAFSCVLVPVVLVVFGTSVGGAAVPALGLLAVTAVCRLLLRRSEQSLRAQRTAGNTRPQGAHRGARTRGRSTPGD
ncbi:hypothetical protein ACFUN8_04255 [Streptomyces sp. NPDC057307]|uniref:hypothetical protein n=1 Tax=Streptomyces sp. NPDC057307 TaxID=3346096 RepID=UPI00363FFDDD